MLRILLILLLLISIPDCYIWWMYLRDTPSPWRLALLLLPTLGALSCMALFLCRVEVPGLLQITFALLLCIAVPKLTFVLADLLGRGTVALHLCTQRWATSCAMALALLMAAAQLYGTLWGWRRLQVCSTELKVDGLPKGFEGYRIVQISDLHLGSYAGHTDFVAQMVDSVNRQQPDLIVFTGDLVNTTAEEAAPFVETLSRLRAKDGVLAILGNHDYMTYASVHAPRERVERFRQLLRMEGEMGWEVLQNRHRTLLRGGDTLYVAGVENISKPPFPSYGNLDKALADIPPHGCTLLLSHDPGHWRRDIVGRHPQVALMLSGHTHALQLQIGGFSPASWMMPEWGGLYREGHQQLYVSTGIGGSIPYRLGAWPQIEVLTLRGFNR